MPVAHVATKVCKSCLMEKPAGSFYRGERACKECRSAAVQEAKRRAIGDPAEAERRRAWRRDHKRKLRRLQGIPSREQLRRQAQDRAALAKATHAKQHDAHVRKWRAALKARESYHRQMMAPSYVLDQRMRTATKKALRRGKGGRSWERLVGYSLNDLVSHIERQFIDGMSWSNMGEWHIDHIVPRAAFSYASADDPDFKACWALTNLRPLWAVDNHRKRDHRTLLV